MTIWESRLLYVLPILSFCPQDSINLQEQLLVRVRCDRIITRHVVPKRIIFHHRCYNSREPGGRTERVMIAHLTSRMPIAPRPVLPMPDKIPWAVPYVAGDPVSVRQYPREGYYTLNGTASGYASFSLLENTAKTRLRTVTVDYHAYSEDGRSFLHGTHNVT